MSRQARSSADAENNYRLSADTNKYFTFRFGAVVSFLGPLWYTRIISSTDDIARWK